MEELKKKSKFCPQIFPLKEYPELCHSPGYLLEALSSCVSSSFGVVASSLGCCVPTLVCAGEQLRL